MTTLQQHQLRIQTALNSIRDDLRHLDAPALWYADDYLNKMERHLVALVEAALSHPQDNDK